MGIRCPTRPLDDRVPRGGRASLRGRVRLGIKPRKRYGSVGRSVVAAAAAVVVVVVARAGKFRT
jgi:hypothetical protein